MASVITQHIEVFEEFEVLEVAHGPDENDAHCHDRELPAQVELVAEVVAVKGGENPVELVADYHQKCDANTKTGNKNGNCGQVFDAFATH